MCASCVIGNEEELCCLSDSTKLCKQETSLAFSHTQMDKVKSKLHVGFTVGVEQSTIYLFYTLYLFIKDKIGCQGRMGFAYNMFGDFEVPNTRQVYFFQTRDGQAVHETCY